MGYDVGRWWQGADGTRKSCRSLWLLVVTGRPVIYIFSFAGLKQRGVKHFQARHRPPKIHLSHLIYQPPADPPAPGRSTGPRQIHRPPADPPAPGRSTGPRSPTGAAIIY
ncbi:hypothetical protein NG798_25265 [Ancylothrix sp. C2]|uniref:hypothetical protein n=1 Tax=Ancylothrix sp. D3o TaxID=2953691 RepID=UPI0021BB744C|nr:hypothetical protein [Ancylothrix sp. D3o]MCT7953112.1 hypothetical protein [Ancylothrix sp. D3o]